MMRALAVAVSWALMLWLASVAAAQPAGEGEPGGVWCFHHDRSVRFPDRVTCPKPWRPDRVVAKLKRR